MKGAGYNTHGRRYTAKEVCGLNQAITDSASKKQLWKQKEPQKGPKAIIRDLYTKKDIEEFNKYANKLIKIGCKKEVIMSWIEDLIKPEDRYIIEKNIDVDKDICSEEKTNVDESR